MSTQRSIGRAARSSGAAEARRGASDDARKYAIRDRSTGTPPATVDPLYAITTGVVFPVSGAIMLSRLRGVSHTGAFDRVRAYAGGAAAGTVPVGLAVYVISQEVSAQPGSAGVAIGVDQVSMDLELLRGTEGWGSVGVGAAGAEVIFRSPLELDPDLEYAVAMSVVGTVDGAAMGTYPGTRGQSLRLRTVLAAGDGFPATIRIRDSDVVAAVDPWVVMSVLLSRTHLPGFVMP